MPAVIAAEGDGFRARDRRHRGRRGCGQRAARGVIPLVWGAAALVRAIPGWWRLLAIPAAWLFFEFMLFPLTMAVFATNEPPGPLGPATPASYGLAYHDVALRTADGVRLSAWYIPSRNGAAVVLLPGSGSTRSAVLAQAAVLARHGYGTLLMDGRGHGLSGGHAMDFGWWGDRDTAAAVSFLARQPGVRSARSPRWVSRWEASRASPRWVPTRGFAPWSPRAPPASSLPTTAGSRTASPDPGTRRGMGAVHRGRAAQRRPPPDEHPRRHPRRPPPGADHRRRGRRR